jgi:RimJ/RimL family protein N-acetyltransferase
LVHEVELGYVVCPERWGRGLATEMGSAIVNHAFSELALGSVVAFTRVDNAASRRVMEKLGFRYERTFSNRGAQSVLYRLRASRDPEPPVSSS